MVYRKQYRVSALTSTTGVTLVPRVGERGNVTGGAINSPIADPTNIELTYTVTPSHFTVNKIFDITFQEK